MVGVVSRLLLCLVGRFKAAMMLVIVNKERFKLNNEAFKPVTS